jgi:hypothetical protein
MAHFQENRFLGLSSRTLLVTIGIVAVVVGLFFIPKMIQTRWSSPKASSSTSQVASQQMKTKQSESVTEQRAAISPGALKGLASDLDDSEKIEKKSDGKGKSAKGTDGETGGSAGLFSGWNVKVRARGNSDAGNKDLPKGVSLDTLNTKEAAAFFRRSKGDIARFVDRNRLKQTPVKVALEPFTTLIDQVANGLGKNVDPADIAQQLVAAHSQLLQTFSSLGFDRGMLLDWLDIPLMHLIDRSKGGNVTASIFNSFSPRISLRNVSIRERESRNSAAPSSAMMNAEIAVKGTDVEAVTVFHHGQPIREVKLGRPDGQGYRMFKINGDAQGQWAFQAHDKFGAQPMMKVYSFYPRVRRFRRLEDGSYDIGFLPRSARNSLDKYFAVAISAQQVQQSSDPSVTIF